LKGIVGKVIGDEAAAKMAGDFVENSTTLILPQNKCKNICIARQLKAYLKFRPSIDGQLVVI
jgi:hypothetical protein